MTTSSSINVNPSRRICGGDVIAGGEERIGLLQIPSYFILNDKHRLFPIASQFSDLFGLEFNEDLDQGIGRDALGGGHLLDGAGGALGIMLTEPENGAGGVIALDRKFHA
jgi:hypothetical protein